MRSAISAALICGSLAMWASARSDAPAAVADADGWLTDYAAARKKAKDAGKPLLVVFR